ncbi:hypothetical protein QTI66_30300 [Variovorax sp. J22R133]|uniref:hypothetical protein n=1 Tax=Variovorax brevis TaxID=3053503 RepID=UPI002576B2AB|nr:hypothetical protein [Variovorax sp. J22R133]MDM0116441.1 hypothetical protein [Variovorax sp. J22R133]
MSHLRRVSVYVDEPEPGRFYWVLHESTADPTVWIEFATSEEPFDMWLDAFDAGTVELMQLVYDERIGPRAPGEDEDAAPVG